MAKGQHLGVSYCYELTDAALVAVAKGCPGLQHLDLSGCTALTEVSLTEVSLVAVAKGCPGLQYLSIFRVFALTSSIIERCSFHDDVQVNSEHRKLCTLRERRP